MPIVSEVTASDIFLNVSIRQLPMTMHTSQSHRVWPRINFVLLPVSYTLFLSIRCIISLSLSLFTTRVLNFEAAKAIEITSKNTFRTWGLSWTVRLAALLYIQHPSTSFSYHVTYYSNWRLFPCLVEDMVGHFSAINLPQVSKRMLHTSARVTLYCSISDRVMLLYRCQDLIRNFRTTSPFKVWLLISHYRCCLA